MTCVLFDFVSIVYQKKIALEFIFVHRGDRTWHDMGIGVVYTEHYALAVNSSYRVIG